MTSPDSCGSTGDSQNYDVNLALSSEGRRTRAPSTQKFGLLIMFCQRDSSRPVESIQSTVRPPCLPVGSWDERGTLFQRGVGQFTEDCFAEMEI